MAERDRRRLYRTQHDRMIGGVAGGLADYFDIDPVLVRLLWVVIAIFTGGAAVLVYILLWIIVPHQGVAGSPARVIRSNVDDMATEAQRVADEFRRATTGESEEERAAQGEGTASLPGEEPRSFEPEAPAEPARRGMRSWAGFGLIVLGLLFLASNLRLFTWFDWGMYWPVALVLIGLVLLWNQIRS